MVDERDEVPQVSVQKIVVVYQQIIDHTGSIGVHGKRAQQVGICYPPSLVAAVSHKGFSENSFIGLPGHYILTSRKKLIVERLME